MKSFLLLSSSLLLTGSVHAQLGVRAGANLTSLHEGFSPVSFPTTSLAQVGYQLGVFYELPLGARWALVPELQFTRQRQQLRKEGFGYSNYFLPTGDYIIHDYELSGSYLSLPVVLRRYVGPAYVEIGPQISWLVGGRGEGETRLLGLPLSRQPISQATSAAYQRLEAGICLGLGVRLPAGWGAGVRAYWGSLRSRPEDPKDYQYSPGAMPVVGTQQLRMFQLSLSRQISVKKA